MPKHPNYSLPSELYVVLAFLYLFKRVSENIKGFHLYEAGERESKAWNV